MTTSSSSSVDNQLSSFNIYEAIVVGVDLNTGEIYVSSKAASGDAGLPEKIPPVYFGGSSDAGIYQHPEIGDMVICARVHPGSHGVTQALRVIPKATAHLSSMSASPPEGSPPGRSNYPISGLNPGEVRIRGAGGGEIYLRGGESAPKAGVFVGNHLRSGIYIYNSRAHKTNLTTISHSMQSVSSAHRAVTSDIMRAPRTTAAATRASYTCGHTMLAYPVDVGLARGLYPGSTASAAKVLGTPRNPAISEYRMVINEVSESSFFNGWDVEASVANSAVIPAFNDGMIKNALLPGNVLHLAPHQLIEVIGGNVVNARGESMDPNYGVVKIGNAIGMISGDGLNVKYEEARLKSRRGIGYHFQLSTNSKSGEISNDYDNFVFAIDKEGVLKLNVPKTSKTGNVLYPTKARFYSSGSDGIVTSPDTFRNDEKIPVTLRNKDNDAILPSETAADAMSSSEDGVLRYTGVRFTNEDDYFQGLGSGTSRDGNNVRINSTKYHNMYAAAEMLIANTIKSVLIPFQNAKCTGYIPGNSVGKSFERKSEDYEADGSDGTEVNYMSAVGVSPAYPAINPGGGVFVAGQDLTLDTGENGERTNIQYTNSFTVSEGAPDVNGRKELGTTNTDTSGEPRQDSGGKSANLNFEGSIEASVGHDNGDKKSIVLDTAGSLVAWFGRDKYGRSMVVQTDGEVLLNVGGTNGNEFNAGRFDLRVNVTHKGFLGEDDVNVGNASDYIISISKSGMVIAGMNPGAPMIIRNDGDICVESTSKLILAGQTVEVREGNRPPRKTYKDPVSADTPDATIEGVPEQISCILEAIEDILD